MTNDEEGRGCSLLKNYSTLNGEKVDTQLGISSLWDGVDIQ